MTTPHPPAPNANPQAPARVAWWNERQGRAILYQILVVAGVVLLASYLVANTLANLESRNIATGFGFLEREAGFGISEATIAYSPADTYLRALVVGLLNTLLIAVAGIVLATILGTLAGIARLSHNWLVAQLAAFYVESLRNIPVLLQLFFWYSLITEGLPLPRQALNPLPGVYLSNRGLFVPLPAWDLAFGLALAALAAAIAATAALAVWGRRRQERTGKILPTFRIGLALIIGLPMLAWLAGGAPRRSTPQPSRVSTSRAADA